MDYIEKAADRSDKETFVEVLNGFIAEATRGTSLASDETDKTEIASGTTPAASPAKRPRCKSRQPVVLGDADRADAPDRLPPASVSAEQDPANLAQQLVLRGLNIQYPFSQLILTGDKTIEARRYALGHLNIARPGEEQFIIETPGKGVSAALVGEAAVGPRPRVAQVVGTAIFSKSSQYTSARSWSQDRPKHRIAQGSTHDCSGEGEMHAWHVAEVKRFREPVPAGAKSQVGYGTPRALQVVIERGGGADAAAEGGATLVDEESDGESGQARG